MFLLQIFGASTFGLIFGSSTFGRENLQPRMRIRIRQVNHSEEVDGFLMLRHPSFIVELSDSSDNWPNNMGIEYSNLSLHYNSVSSHANALNSPNGLPVVSFNGYLELHNLQYRDNSGNLRTLGSHLR